MNKNQKGFASIVIILTVVALLAGGILAWQYFGAPEKEVKAPEEMRGPYIKVISPKSGENWMEGETYDIIWESSGIEKVNIEIVSGGKKLGHLAFGIDAKLGKYRWEIPKGFITGFGIPKLDLMKIIICSVESPSICGHSDGYFSISGEETKSMKIASLFCQKQEIIIEGFPEPIKIKLAKSFPISFKSPEQKEILVLCGKGVSGGHVMLAVLDEKGNPLLQKVAEDAAIAGQRYFTFEDPIVKDIDKDGLEEIIYKEAAWALSMASNEIYLYSPKYQEWMYIKERIELSYPEERLKREIEYSENLNLPNRSVFKEVLYEMMKNWDWAPHRHQFPWGLKMQPYIKVLSPNGGEEWQEGKTYTIKWESDGVNKVNIEYGNGQSWYIVRDYSAEIGEYSWTPQGIVSQYEEFVYPENLTEVKLIITIRDAENREVVDRSDNVFILKE